MRRLAFLLLLPSAVLAQDPGTLLGAAVRSRPDYDGASKRAVDLIPVVRWYGETWFARTSQGILEGGARKELLQGLHAGAQLAYEPGNDRTDVDPGASLGLHLEWDTRVGPAPLTLLGRTRHHIDSDLGTQTDLRGTLGVYASRGVLAGVFAQATWASDKWIRSYYGAGEGGLWFTSLGALGSYDIRREWVAVASVERRRLHGDAATSPITERRSANYLSAGVVRRF
jgi:outer membrane scaffolding protein for murein synthesis (MipA/OmpV family)